MWIDIRKVDYTEECSCCDSRANIIIEVDSMYATIIFCKNCWKEFINKMKNYINNE